jgi:DNA-directed RNA polymerase subunit N (RpoN/RPB10)
MIIPIRCFTCGHVLADKWLYWQREMARLQTTPVTTNAAAVTDAAVTDAAAPFDDLRAGALLDALGLHRMCCRRHLLTHVDIIDVT